MALSTVAGTAARRLPTLRITSTRHSQDSSRAGAVLRGPKCLPDAKPYTHVCCTHLARGAALPRYRRQGQNPGEGKTGEHPDIAGSGHGQGQRDRLRSHGESTRPRCRRLEAAVEGAKPLRVGQASTEQDRETAADAERGTDA